MENDEILENNEVSVRIEVDERILAKIKIDETGRCVGANLEFTDQDTVIEKEFANDSEALEFYSNLTDYIYKDEAWELHPVYIEQNPSDTEVLGQMATDAELERMELGQRMTDLELMVLEGGI